MKIGIIGAPGSGKSKIAKRTAALLKSQGETNWSIIDSYVDGLSKQTTMTFGINSTVPQNLSVITTRWIKEVEQYSHGNHTITCGTIYESILYTTFLTMYSSPEEDVIARETILNNILLQCLGALEQTTYEYDALFFLPYDDKKMGIETDTVNGILNKNLPDVLTYMNKEAILLDQKTDKAKAETIVEVIGKIDGYYKSLLTENDQQAV